MPKVRARPDSTAAQDAWSTALAGISIADLAAGIDADSGGTALRDVRGWLSRG